MRQIVALLLLIAAAPASAANYALLIGINDYDRTTIKQGVVALQFAAQDALALRDLLKAKDFQVTMLDNRNARAEFILEEFRHLRETIKPEDSFLLFFAGHGVRDPSNGQTYWLTYDTNLENLDRNGIRLAHLLDFVRDIRASKKLVLLDHCFSGDVIEDVAAAVNGTPAPAAPDGGRNIPARPREKVIDAATRGIVATTAINTEIEENAAGLVVLAAARHVAFESPTLSHGVFTEALIRAFETHRADAGDPGDQLLGVTELIAFVTSEVKAIGQSIGVNQQVMQVTNATNIGEWTVAKLPPLSADAAEQRDSYLRKLASWRNRPEGGSWISVAAVTICRDVLDAWVASLEGGGTLDPISMRIKDTIKEHMDLVSNAGHEPLEKSTARNLEAEVNRLWEQRPPPPG
jgi:hypothetical protein